MGRKQRAHKEKSIQYESDHTSNESSETASPPKTKKNQASTSHAKTSSKAISRFDSYKILLVRPIPLDAHPAQVVDIITRHRWQRFMRPEVPCYPRVVREFYANLDINLTRGILTSRVSGTEVTITQTLLNDFYGFSSGAGLVQIGKKIHEKEWPQIKSVLKYDPCRDSSESTKQLNPNHIIKLSSCGSLAKLLARILQENLIQIGFHKSDWTNAHLLAVYHLLSKDTLDTAQIIFTTIAHQLLPRSKILPYGNSICELLVQHFRFDLSHEKEGQKAYRFTPQALDLNDDDELDLPPSPHNLPSSFAYKPQHHHMAQVISRLTALEATVATLVNAVTTLTSTLQQVSRAVNKLLKPSCGKPKSKGKEVASSTAEEEAPIKRRKHN